LPRKELCSPSTDSNGRLLGGQQPGAEGRTAGKHNIDARDRWERIADRASQAAESAGMRAKAARGRREETARRLLALRGERAGGGPWLRTAAGRAAAGAEALAIARVHAVDALDRSAEAHRASALAHERAADAAETRGNAAAVAQHRGAAAKAREAAELDRHAADQQRRRG
jgi:hypothetical protein